MTTHQPSAFDWHRFCRSDQLYQKLNQMGLSGWRQPLEAAFERFNADKQERRINDCLQAVIALGKMRPAICTLDNQTVKFGAEKDSDAAEVQNIKEHLQALHPWRKGPFSIFGVQIDAEWCSNLKWDRIAPVLGNLQGRKVLDIGCGNGYYACRMLGAGAAFVLGVEPGILQAIQFMIFAHWLPETAWVIPARLEDLPDEGAFDLVVSMGVLTHQRHPCQHLAQLKTKLVPGSRLLLETLVVEGPAGYKLIPKDRYARMRNVWVLPSPLTLEHWLMQSGYQKIQLVRTDRTTTAEQRSTEWMRFESLSEALDPSDPTQTIEGYPAPLRCIFEAQV